MDALGAGISGGIAGLISTLGGIFASGDSLQEESYQKIFKMIQDYLPELKKQSYSKAEIETIVKSMQTMYRGAGNLAATKVGQAIGESGVTPGQGFAEYYTSSVAPIMAEGQQQAAGAEQWGVGAYNDIYNSAKDRTLQGLNLMTGAAAGMPNMSSGQKGIAGFLQTLNLLATGGGNFANMYKNFNMKYPTTDQNGNIIYQ